MAASSGVSWTKEEEFLRVMAILEAEDGLTKGWRESEGEMASSLEKPFWKAWEGLSEQVVCPPELNALGMYGLEESKGEEVRPLSSWQEKGWEFLRREEIAEVVDRLVGVFERMAEAPYRLPCLVPGLLGVGQKTGRLYGSWRHLSGLRLEGQQRHLKEHQQDLRFELPPSWSRGFPGDVDKHLPQAMAYSFGIFLLRLLHRHAEALWKQRRLEALAVLCEGLPAEVPLLLEELLNTASEKASEEAGLPKKSLLCRFWQMLRGLLASREEGKKKALRWEKESYQIGGQGKKGPLQDVEMTAPFSAPALFFGGIADGVSTADLGSGEDAAREAARCFADWILEHGRKWAETEASKEATLLFWEGFAREANQAIAARLEGYLQASQAPKGSAKDTMSSTFTAVAVHGDRVSLAWLGDSPAWHYQAKEGRLLRLTTAHAKVYERLRQGEAPAFEAPRNLAPCRPASLGLANLGHACRPASLGLCHDFDPCLLANLRLCHDFGPCLLTNLRLCHDFGPCLLTNLRTRCTELSVFRPLRKSRT